MVAHQMNDVDDDDDWIDRFRYFYINLCCHGSSNIIEII